ncbi:MAG TPA: Fic family protein [archaeon]|nr:Fic family protein [archaeon]
MVHVSRKKISGKYYRYVSKSVRLPSGKVTTMTRLLHKKENPGKHSAFFLKKEQELNAKWALKTYKKSYIFSEQEIKKIEAIRISYKYLLKNLSKDQLKDVFDRFTANFTYNSNAIEGNSLTLRDVGIVIFDKASIEGKELREIYETRNSRNVVDMVLRKHFDIVESDVIKMHHLLMKDIDPRKGYKKLPNVIFHQEKQVETTKPENVQKEMKSLIEWYDKNKGSMHPLELAAVFHGKFEKIHPFEDGNGRVGRFLINVILVNSGYPPLIVRKTNRMAYMKCLEAFDSGYEDRLKRFVLSKFKDTFAKFFEVYVKYA